METKTITAFDKNDFRKWLIKNHGKEEKVSVILYKKHTGKPASTHRELMEEAICFGWIDTTVKRLDEDRYIRNFSRRNKNSRWSDNTLSYARKLIKDKRMTEAGLEFYRLGLKKPTHDHGIPKNPNMPSDLSKALSKNKKIRQAFNVLAPSKKKMLYRWILRAKLAETRQKRVDSIVKSIRDGDKL